MGILLGEFYEKKFKVIDEKPWFVFAVLTTGIAVLVAFTRGIWGACAIALVIMAFFTNARFAWRLSALLAVAFIALFFSWPQFHDRILFAFNFEKNYDGDRVALWRANWEMFLDHPLFGIGYGEYKTILRSYFDRLDMPPSQFASHAHNQYLHFLAGTGILGLTCFIAYVGYGLKMTIQGIRNSAQNISEKRFLVGALGAQICFLISALTESNFERSKVRLVYLIISGLAIAITLRRKNQDNIS
jgi:O-antigen ligase